MDPNKENPTTNPEASEVPAANDVVPASPFLNDETNNQQPQLTPEEAQPVAPFESQAPADTPGAVPTSTEPQSPQESTITPDTPVAPDVPVATPFTPGAPVPEPQKKNTNTKKIIIIVSAVVAVASLALAAAIIFFLLSTVSKNDYRMAVQQYNQVSSASAALDTDMSNLGNSYGSVSEATFDENLTKAQDSINKIKTENESFAKMKAVRVGEGATLYSTFNDKLTTYLAYGNDLVTSVKNLRPAMVVCDKVGDADAPDARISELKNCATSLGDAKDLPNAEFKTFVGEMKDAYTQYATTYEKMNALTDPYGSQYEEYLTLRDQLYDTQDAISVATKTFTDALAKHDDEVSVKDAANALGDFLEVKQR